MSGRFSGSISVFSTTGVVLSSLGVLMDAVKLPYDKHCFDRALSASEFANLQELEKAHGFREKPLQDSSFFLSGKMNEYKDYLNAKQIREVIENHRDIMNRFGYITDME